MAEKGYVRVGDIYVEVEYNFDTKEVVFSVTTAKQLEEEG